MQCPTYRRSYVPISRDVFCVPTYLCIYELLGRGIAMFKGMDDCLARQLQHYGLGYLRIYVF